MKLLHKPLPNWVRALTEIFLIGSITLLVFPFVMFILQMTLESFLIKLFGKDFCWFFLNCLSCFLLFLSSLLITYVLYKESSFSFSKKKQKNSFIFVSKILGIILLPFVFTFFYWLVINQLLAPL
ncbi:hypothetical protein KKG24_02735 [Patescibacteria group bacterium]|nr:hypothetical protein [Patescibacteria group bacterium]